MPLWDNAQALRRINMWLYAIVAGCLLTAAVVWVIDSPYFPIKHVQINGRLQRVSEAQLQQVAQQTIRGNIFKVNIRSIKASYQALPWVKSATVKRLWPDTIAIEIVERQPVARWGSQGFVDEDGVLFQAASDEHFPVFEGQAAAAVKMVGMYRQLQPVLVKAQLDIAKLNYSARSAWTVELHNGTVLKLGRKEPQARAQRLASVWPTVLQPQAAQLAYVDLRYKDGFAVKLKNGDASGAVQAASAAEAE